MTNDESMSLQHYVPAGDLIEGTFQRQASPYLTCNDRNAYITSDDGLNFGFVKTVCDVLSYILDIYFY